MQTLIQTPQQQKPEKPDTVIHIGHLRKSFGGREILHDLNLDLYEGENLVILGRSGEGKSVTIKCIAGLLQQDGGDCLVYGKDVRNLPETELRELRVKIGFLFQSGALYDSMSVRDNLAFPLTRVLKMRNQRKINSLVEEMLDHVGLLDSIDKMPADLSGGMRKRIGVARTLIVKPRIMLYDEPTTGLDPITSREISELIMNVRDKYKTSSIIITHDIACAHIIADRILVMHDGVFIEEGTYEELARSENELVHAFFKTET